MLSKRKALDVPNSAYLLLMNVGFMEYKFNAESYEPCGLTDKTLI